MVGVVQGKGYHDLGALPFFGLFDRITRVAQIEEVDAFDDTAIQNIKTGDDAFS